MSHRLVMQPLAPTEVLFKFGTPLRRRNCGHWKDTRRELVSTIQLFCELESYIRADTDEVHDGAQHRVDYHEPCTTGVNKITVLQTTTSFTDSSVWQYFDNYSNLAIHTTCPSFALSALFFFKYIFNYVFILFLFLLMLLEANYLQFFFNQ